MADKEAANRFNFESVETKEEFLVYLKNKKMTHNKFFYIHCKICEGSFPTEKKYKEGYIDAAEVERIFALKQQGAHTKADNVLKRVWTCKTNALINADLGYDKHSASLCFRLLTAKRLVE